MAWHDRNYTRVQGWRGVGLSMAQSSNNRPTTVQPLPNHLSGSIEVICGCMFSGKTEELIRRLKRARIARQRVRIVKPALDDRYAADAVVSHDAGRLDCIPMADAQAILADVVDEEVVGIDEAQFFGEELVEVVQALAKRGLRVIVAGLDMDYRAQPFGPMPALLAIAESVTKLAAVCVRCGAEAHFSYRLTGSEQTVMVGAAEAYEPRCRSCYEVSGAAPAAMRG